MNKYTAQPSLDAGRIQLKKFKLAMSAGKNRHYTIQDIMPRHFLQTAEIAGVSQSLILAIFEDLAANIEKAIDDVINTLPVGFPDQLVISIRQAVISRALLLVKN